MGCADEKEYGHLYYMEFKSRVRGTEGRERFIAIRLGRRGVEEMNPVFCKIYSTVYVCVSSV